MIVRKREKSIYLILSFKVFKLTHTHTYIYIYMCVCVCVCVCVSPCVSVCVCYIIDCWNSSLASNVAFELSYNRQNDWKIWLACHLVWVMYSEPKIICIYGYDLIKKLYVQKKKEIFPFVLLHKISVSKKHGPTENIYIYIYIYIYILILMSHNIFKVIL